MNRIGDFTSCLPIHDDVQGYQYVPTRRLFEEGAPAAGRKRKHDSAIIEPVAGPRLYKSIRPDVKARIETGARTMQILMDSAKRPDETTQEPAPRATSHRPQNILSTAPRREIQGPSSPLTPTNMSHPLPYLENNGDQFVFSLAPPTCTGCGVAFTSSMQDKSTSFSSTPTNQGYAICTRCGDAVCGLCAVKTYDDPGWDESVVCLQCYK